MFSQEAYSPASGVSPLVKDTVGRSNFRTRQRLSQGYLGSGIDARRSPWIETQQRLMSQIYGLTGPGLASPPPQT